MVRGQFALLPIQGDELLTVPGKIDVDTVVRQAVIIEDVQGVAQLHEHVIGSVHHVVDGPQP